MKFNYIYIFIFLVGVFSCNEFEDENLDFSNNLPQYVELSSSSEIKSVEGGSVDVVVRMREVYPSDVTVSYQLTGGISSTGEIVIPSSSLTATATISIPDNVVLDGAGDTTTLTLTGVDNGLTIGRGGPDAGLSAISRNITWVEDLKVIGFASADTTEISEAVIDGDTLFYIVSSTIAVESDVSVNYSITGDLTEGVDYSLLSANPLVISKDSVADTIAIVVNSGIDNQTADPGRDIYVQLTSISGGNAETSLSTSADSKGFTVIDDSRVVSFSGQSTSVSGKSTVDIPVSITDLGFDHASSLSVAYTVTGGVAGVDYEDVKGGVLTFVDADTETIRINVEDTGDFTLTVTLTSVDDPEASIGNNNTYEIVADN